AAYPWIGAHQRQRADGGFEDAAQAVVDAHPLELGLGRDARRLAGDGVAQLELVAVGLADDDGLVRAANVELPRAQRFENGSGPYLARCGESSNCSLAVAKSACREAGYEPCQGGGH